MSWILCVFLALSVDDTVVLKPGDDVSGVVQTTDPVIHSPALDGRLLAAAGKLTHGRRYRVEIAEGGSYTIDLKAYLFEPYLIVRAADGTLLSEDTGSLHGHQCRVVTTLDAGQYWIEACALDAHRGPFELSILVGEPPPLSEQETGAARSADLQRMLDLASEELVRLESSLGPDHIETALIAERVALALFHQGQFKAAQESCERVLTTREQQLGPEHVDVGESLYALGVILDSNQKYSEALPFLQRSLAIRERACGRDHPELAREQEFIGGLCRHLRKLDDAQVCFERSLSIREAQLGPEHIDLVPTLDRLANFLRSRRRPAAAQPLYERALAIREKKLGADHLDVASTLNRLALVIDQQRRLSDARPYYERALGIWIKVLGPEHLTVAASSFNFGSVLTELGEHDEARPHLERALAIRRTALKESDPLVASSIQALAVLCRHQARYEEGEALFRECLALRRSTLDPKHADIASTLNSLAVLLGVLGRNEEALPLLEESLSIQEHRYGRGHPQTTVALVQLAGTKSDLQDFEGAVKLYESAITNIEKARGPKDVSLCLPLRYYAEHMESRGKYEGALQLAQRAHDIRQERFGPKHSTLVARLRMMARLQKKRGNYGAAYDHYHRALEIARQTLGPQHRQVAICLSNLAPVYFSQKKYTEARQLLEQSLEIRPDHAPTLSNLGRTLAQEGRYLEARRCLERALTLTEAKLGSEHVDVADILEGLTWILGHVGKDTEKRVLIDRVLAIRRKALGSDHVDTIRAVYHKATRLSSKGKHQEAEVLLKESLAAMVALLGPDHLQVGSFQLGMAAHQQRFGDLDAAESLLKSTEAIQLRVLGTESHALHDTRALLAGVCARRGDYDRARKLYRSCLRAFDPDGDSESKETVTALHNLMLVEASSGRSDEALSLARRVFDAKETLMNHELTMANEPDALRRSDQQRGSLRILLELLSKGGRYEEMYMTIAMWKGRVSRWFGRSKRSLYKELTASERETLDRLRAAQSGLSNALTQTKILDREEHERNLRRLRKECDRLGAELQSKGAGKLSTIPNREEIAAALPEDGVWIDFFEYKPFRRSTAKNNTLALWPAQMVAFVIRPDGELTHLSLGESHELKGAIRALLAAVSGRTASDPNRGFDVDPDDDPPADAQRSQCNARVRSLLWDPLEKHVGDAKQVFIGPDASLAQLPFEILEGVNGEFLIEKHSFTYLRDAAALRDRTRPPTLEEKESRAVPTLLAIGAIDYDDRTESPDATELAGLRGSDGVRFQDHWSSLSETGREVGGIHELYEELHESSGSRLLQGSEATEERLKRELSRHSVVHIATHGYFQPEALVSSAAIAPGVDPSAVVEPWAVGLERELVTQYRPGLLSGLVCAGANSQLDPSRDNGLLTAEEVSWIDLSRCDLVVLSACETALGSSQAGEGMMSLRRAFHQSGAQTVISSLWKVRDDSTRELMLLFYDNLWKKKLGKLEALRTAQLEMLRRNRQRLGAPLPATWGAFVLSGSG